MRPILSLLLLLCLINCTTQPATDPQKRQVFLDSLEGGDYHTIARQGEQVFHVGQIIPDYALRLSAFPNQSYAKSQVRYVLFRFEGDVSLGEVYLVLDVTSGEIIEFKHFEAFLE